MAKIFIMGFKEEQVKQLITLIGTLEHPDAWQHIDGKALREIQEKLAGAIDETDHAWQLTK